MDVIQSACPATGGLTKGDLALAEYEQRRAAANDDRAHVFAATVTVKTGKGSLTYPSVGFSTAAMEASARELYGDEPVGISVMVKQ